MFPEILPLSLLFLELFLFESWIYWIKYLGPFLLPSSPQYSLPMSFLFCEFYLTLSVFNLRNHISSLECSLTLFAPFYMALLFFYDYCWEKQSTMVSDHPACSCWACQEGKRLCVQWQDLRSGVMSFPKAQSSSSCTRKIVSPPTW